MHPLSERRGSALATTAYFQPSNQSNTPNLGCSTSCIYEYTHDKEFSSRFKTCSGWSSDPASFLVSKWFNDNFRELLLFFSHFRQRIFPPYGQYCRITHTYLHLTLKILLGHSPSKPKNLQKAAIQNCTQSPHVTQFSVKEPCTRRCEDAPGKEGTGIHGGPSSNRMSKEIPKTGPQGPTCTPSAIAHLQITTAIQEANPRASDAEKMKELTFSTLTHCLR